MTTALGVAGCGAPDTTACVRFCNFSQIFSCNGVDTDGSYAKVATHTQTRSQLGVTKMSKLNTQWMASVLAQVIANTAQGVPTFVGEHPEIMALKEAGFIKIDKRKKGEEEGTFASIATETATMDAFHAAFPADTAQAPQVAPQSAEVDTAAQVAADQAAQLAATAQPQFTDAPAPQAAPAPAPAPAPGRRC